ncbi:MAG TPA: hypothetical protein VL400_19830 [Polyangiaceae bacterium]|nr:hypothetical protein [Polyangiaceae bacterium]
MLRSPFVLGSLLAVLFATGSASADPTCLAPAPPDATRGTADEVFGRARRAFEEKRFADAATLFASVATEHADSPVGVHAAELSLESINAARSDACVPTMATLSLRYEKLYCAAATRKSNEEACGVFERVSADVARLSAERLVESADASRGEAARRRYLEAGDAYAAIWRSSFEEPCRAGKKERCARGDEILYNSARAYQAARDPSKARAMRGVLIDPKNGLADGALAKRALYEIGGSYQAMAEYAEAATFYERFARDAPKEERAPDALSDAIILRLGLSDRATAAKDADLFEKQYGAKREGDVAMIAFALAAEDLRAGDAALAEKRISSRRALIEKTNPELSAPADVVLGKALLLAKKTDDAKRAFQRAASFDVTRLRLTDDAVSLRMLGRALTAIGEAKVKLADEARDAAMKLPVKKGDVASVLKKRDAILAAEKAYVAVVDLQPAAPPGPVVAAAGKAARMRTRLWAEAYLALGDEASAPFFADAKAANARCVDLSVKYQFRDEGARRCAAWLIRHFPAEFAAMNEIPPKLRVPDGDPPPRARPLDEDSEEALPILARPHE